jgi:hypothetical protein
MPYDPNNPNQAEHDPEHLNENRDPAPYVPYEEKTRFIPPDEPQTLQQKIDSCYVHAMVRGHARELEWAISRLHQIADSLERSFITKDQAIVMMEHVYDNHVVTNNPDEVAIGAIDEVVAWLKAHPGA